MPRYGPSRPSVQHAFPRRLAFLAVVASVAVTGCAPDGNRAPGEDPGTSAVAAGAPAPEVELGPEVCYDAGYLCTGLAERQSGRILRWPSATSEIKIRVPLPPLEDRRLARALQDAAVWGIRRWDGTPFVLRVERSDRPGSEDLAVRWVDRLDGAELGRAETEWERSADGRMGMRVTDFALVVRSPVRAGEVVSPEQMRLIAAHEMGHALGLPHSDADRDVMYPTNTATQLSARDYRTMNALYRLTNGAILTPDALATGARR